MTIKDIFSSSKANLIASRISGVFCISSMNISALSEVFEYISFVVLVYFTYFDVKYRDDVRNILENIGGFSLLSG